jgi:putative hydrolase
VATSDSINPQIADRLREAADLLEQQRANPFRVHAYRDAAETVAHLGVDLRDVLARDGTKWLMALPGIGAGIAAAIEEMLRTGRWSQLERLRGTLDAEALFRAIPGVGAALARRIHDSLHVDTLQALEVAAHDGRLAAVPGIGLRRAAIIRGGLASMLARPRARSRPGEEPSVETLLDVDDEYREQAAAGRLPRIAPRRFNPRGEAWLPILHTERGKWQFTALFSNTARAHELGRTHDWVVLYFHTDRESEGQRTVVTESRGPLQGRRVVRGREAECREPYRGRMKERAAPPAGRRAPDSRAAPGGHAHGEGDAPREAPRAGRLAMNQSIDTGGSNP